MDYLIKNAIVVNEGESFKGSVLVKDGIIDRVTADEIDAKAEVIDAEGRYLIPGIIDEHVHFREPGLTHKADMNTESHAAVAGGVTSFMDMPNTIPQTTTQELLQQKFDIAAEKSLANYSFYIGATNDNLGEIAKTDPKRVCGVKVFMGSSTGNMLVDDDLALERLFNESPCMVAAHCEDEETIRRNTIFYERVVGMGIMAPTCNLHPMVRSEEACYKSSSKAVELAEKTGARLHVLHVSTKAELSLFRNDIPLKDKKITAETCPHYLFFSDGDYLYKKMAIKCNPAIKSGREKFALLDGIRSGLVDTIGSDHAPHLFNEKRTGNYFTSKSGFPSIQHTLDVMLNVTKFDLPLTVQLMCHNPAILYQIDRRGFVREGYHADLALLDWGKPHIVQNMNEYSKCKWSPYQGMKFASMVTHTFVNGNLVYENGVFHEDYKGERLLFNR